MKPITEETLNDINLLIDISCTETSKIFLFKQFHKLLIALAYEATDIEINYKRKRIYMNVVSEETKGDYLTRYDNASEYKMSANLLYQNLSNFLKTCVNDNSEMTENYSLLKSKFLKSHSKAIRQVHAL